MSYYRGDYYRGDYYRGDPGFLSFLGGAAKAIGGFSPGVGPLISAGGQALSKIGASKAIVKAVPRAVGPATSVLGKLKGGVLKHPVLSGAGAAGLAGAAAGIAGTKLLSHGGGRKRRRMRATNTKALRRALRRAYAFERIAMKTIHLVHPRKKGRFGGFKKPRKRVC
jgi:hypothetical protein